MCFLGEGAMVCAQSVQAGVMRMDKMPIWLQVLFAAAGLFGSSGAVVTFLNLRRQRHLDQEATADKAAVAEAEVQRRLAEQDERVWHRQQQQLDKLERQAEVRDERIAALKKQVDELQMRLEAAQTELAETKRELEIARAERDQHAEISTRRAAHILNLETKIAGYELQVAALVAERDAALEGTA